MRFSFLFLLGFMAVSGYASIEIIIPVDTSTSVPIYKGNVFHLGSEVVYGECFSLEEHCNSKISSFKIRRRYSYDKYVEQLESSYHVPEQYVGDPKKSVAAIDETIRVLQKDPTKNFGTISELASQKARLLELLTLFGRFEEGNDIILVKGDTDFEKVLSPFNTIVDEVEEDPSKTVIDLLTHDRWTLEGQMPLRKCGLEPSKKKLEENLWWFYKSSVAAVMPEENGINSGQPEKKMWLSDISSEGELTGGEPDIFGTLKYYGTYAYLREFVALSFPILESSVTFDVDLGKGQVQHWTYYDVPDLSCVSVHGG